MNTFLKSTIVGGAWFGVSLLIGAGPSAAAEKEAGEVVEAPVSLLADPDHLSQRSTTVYFRVQASDVDGLSAEQNARFLGPVEREHEDKHETKHDKD